MVPVDVDEGLPQRIHPRLLPQLHRLHLNRCVYLLAIHSLILQSRIVLIASLFELGLGHLQVPRLQLL